MLPAIAVAGETALTVAPRLGSWLGRAASGNPAFTASLISRIRAAGIVVGDKIADVVAAAKKSPINALTIVATIASFGYSVTDLFSDAPESDAKNKVLAALNGVTNGSTPAHRDAALALLFKAGEKSTSPDLDISNLDEDKIEALRVTLAWARDHFGNIGSAVRAHTMMQAFFEVPAASVVQGYRQLNLDI